MKYYIFLFIGMLLVSCSNEPEPIVYGSDNCSYCKMTIVSKAHSAQMVTKKGKQIKYDAIECMVQDNLQNYETSEIAVMLVANYEEPGTMLPVEEASFVIDKKITSPMGANLAAINKDGNREEYSEAYTWNELKKHFLKEDPQNLK
ncbi:nitrous oxide reductase accessory protein NosL [Gillisia sp. Q332]|uniref:nitrous oxide reductase accessory protein NosL n=1 Tax=Gillisia xinjiangensis TaxID=3384765 RepID=UPI00391A5B13